MTFDSALEELSDPEQRISAIRLASLSDLSREDVVRLTEVWDEVPADRRRHIVQQLVDLAEDNVDLNFDAIYKAALRDEDAEVRAIAIRGLYEYEGSDLIAPLVLLLRDDENVEVRRESAIALGRYALEAELGYLGDGHADDVRSVLADSATDEDEEDEVRARAIEALGAICDDEVSNLIESLYDEESLALKIGAIDAMGRNCNDAWLPIVLGQLQHPAPEMRHAAAFAAGEIGEEAAIGPLKRAAVEDPDREVRLVAVHALGEIGGPLARVALQNVLYEGDDDLRDAIQEAMTEIAFHENPLGGF